jgi:hypothetical protein
VSGLRDAIKRRAPSFEELDLALASDFDHFDSDEARRVWKRHPVVRIVEYSPYPRRTDSERRARGFTANESRGGVCILTRDVHAVGRALRLTVREVDGSARLEAIARVVWCNPEAGDRVAIGLEFVEVRRSVPPGQRSVSRVEIPSTRQRSGATG